MTVLPERAVGQEAVAQRAQITDPTRAETRGRAVSVPTALVTVQPALSPADRFGHALSRAGEWLEATETWRAKVAAWLARTCQMATRPPSAAELHAAHRDAAAQWEARLLRVPRQVWGALHTAAHAAAFWLLAVLFSPAGAVLALAFIAVCWIWL